MALQSPQRTSLDSSWGLQHGILGGIIAGIVFAMFEMVVAAAMMGADAFFMPLRMIGAIVLGPQALDPSYSLATAAVVGAATHMMLSAVFGVILGVLVAAIPGMAGSTVRLIALASAFGLLLWLVNFYVIAPVAGWVWFPNATNPVVQLVAHTFFFGTVLGIYLRWAAAPHETTTE
ncbi:MAG: hypothetical protein HY690_11510 [Chloroflexi bacterium]|nr:hypothetical protein [Chloroflexota bacterium]